MKKSASMMIDEKEVEGSCGFMEDERYFGGNKQVLINEEKACSSSCSSSIGENSDSISHEESMDEVESPFTSIQPLHQLLPIRQGMSRFYNGKSKSFTSLREASTSSSIKELAKPENASYIKKRRRNILACNLPNKKKSISRKKHIGILSMNCGHSTSSSNHCNGSNLNLSDWRSFSLADLQFVSLTATPPTLEQEAQKKPTDSAFG